MCVYRVRCVSRSPLCCYVERAVCCCVERGGIVLLEADHLDDNKIGALPDGVAVVSAGSVSVTVRGGADLVATLYALGAPLVLPAGLTGCRPQSALGG